MRANPRDESQPALTTRDVATLRWLTLRECEIRLRRNPAQVWALIDAGALPARRYGDGWRVHEDDVRRAEARAA